MEHPGLLDSVCVASLESASCVWVVDFLFGVMKEIFVLHFYFDHYGSLLVPRLVRRPQVLLTGPYGTEHMARE